MVHGERLFKRDVKRTCWMQIISYLRLTSSSMFASNSPAWSLFFTSSSNLFSIIIKISSSSIICRVLTGRTFAITTTTTKSKFDTTNHSARVLDRSTPRWILSNSFSFSDKHKENMYVWAWCAYRFWYICARLGGRRRGLRFGKRRRSVWKYSFRLRINTFNQRRWHIVTVVAHGITRVARRKRHRAWQS